MSYEFKRLSDVEVVEQPLSTANMLIEEEGVIKKAPIGKNNNYDFIIITVVEEGLTGATCNKSYDEVLEMLASGNISYIYLKAVTPFSIMWPQLASGIRTFGSINQNVPATSDSVLGIEFAFGDIAIYYYRDGLSLENRSE